MNNHHYYCLVALFVCFCAPSSGLQEKAMQPNVTLPPLLNFDPAHQKPILYRSPRLKAELITGKPNYSLTIESARGRHVVELPRELAQVDEIKEVSHAKLAVRGMLNSSASEVVVIDTSTSSILDRFYCYLPAFSPDGRYVSYIKFYPTHFAEQTSDHYLLYSFEKSPLENRIPRTSLNDVINVGSPLYPPGIGNRDGDNIITGSTLHQSASAFFWSDDGSRLAFADRAGEQVQVILATVDGGKPSLREVILPITKLCHQFSESAPQACSILVRRVEFRTAPLPRITLFWQVRDPSTRIMTMEIALSQFAEVRKET